jgi:hypothetical protein
VVIDSLDLLLGSTGADRIRMEEEVGRDVLLSRLFVGEDGKVGDAYAISLQ